MKKIKIGFIDSGRDNYQNYITEILKKYYDVEVGDDPDFLFYTYLGCDHHRYKKPIKIYVCTENIRPNFNECDYAVGVDYLDFGDRYYRSPREAVRSEPISDDAALNRKFCNFVYGNETSGEGARLRAEFCKELAAYKHVDCPGNVLNNMARLPSYWGSGGPGAKCNFLKNYKFTIAFENSSASGYVTEKLTHPLGANSVPIYWGDPDVDREFNEKAIIRADKFKNFKELIEYIKYLDQNDSEYLKILREPPMRPDLDRSPDDLDKFLINIIENGARQPKDPRDILELFSRNAFYHTNAESLRKKISPDKSFRENWLALSRDIPILPNHPILDDLVVAAAEAGDVKSGLRSEPPREAPEELKYLYSMGGKIPIIPLYFNNTVSQPVVLKLKDYETAFKKLNDGSFKYYEETLSFILTALDKYPVKGKKALVHGAIGVNMDAIALSRGAKEVVIAEYNVPVSEHPQVSAKQKSELLNYDFKADVSFSISSFEHDGLGRYGDPLNPDGDLLAMRDAKKLLARDGLLYFVAPTGPDCVRWNAHRVYGKIRLPLLFSGWTYLDSFGASHDIFERVPLGLHLQPLYVLSADPAAVNIPPEADESAVAQIKSLAASGAFDRDYYMAAYPETLTYPMDLISHYVLIGADEGKNPNAWFDTLAYLEKNPRLKNSKTNPFYDFMRLENSKPKNFKNYLASFFKKRR